MKLTFHGAAKEVGKSCIEVRTKASRFLLDAGVKLGVETEYPHVPEKVGGIDAAIISHAHLDHSAGLPFMHHNGLHSPIFMTYMTRELAKILIKDFVHVESLSHIPPYTKDDVNAVLHDLHSKEFRQRFSIKDAEFMLFDAGHIPGSAITVIEADGKRLAYTGDTNLTDSRLMKGADINIGEIDALIMETTYGNREHPDRQQTERDFIANIKKVIARGGNAYLAVFGVGRAQEIILMLADEKWDVPVYLDGMAAEVTDLIIQQKACKDIDALRKARDKVIYLKGREEREKAMQSQGIFITTSGMLTGGPVMQYLRDGHQNPKNAFLLTGYVVEGTNGRLLLDEGAVFIEGKKVMMKAEYKQYDFSAHAGLSDLRKLVQKLNPRKLILIHGDPKALESFANEQRSKREVFIPELGSEINI